MIFRSVGALKCDATHLRSFENPTLSGLKNVNYLDELVIKLVKN